jgi:hypothetical protein
MNRKLSSTASIAAVEPMQTGRFVLGMAVAALVGTAGCVVKSTHFRMSTIAPDEAAIAGRLTVLYNGRILTEQCFATFGGSQLGLSSDGIVLFRVKTGWTSLERLACKDGALQHIRIRGAHFYARGNGEVTDFGDVMITWDAAGGFKATWLFGAAGGLIDSVIDDGVVSIDVRPPAAEVRDAFRRQTGIEGRWTVHQLSQPTSRLAQNSAGSDDRQAPAAPAQAKFFCATSPTGRDYRSVCERQQSSCVRARTVLASWKLPPCTPVATAWCFATDRKLHCAENKEACDAQSMTGPPISDTCGEQY